MKFFLAVILLASQLVDDLDASPLRAPAKGVVNYYYGKGLLTKIDGTTEQYLISLEKSKKNSRPVLSYDVQFADRNHYFALHLVYEDSGSNFFSIIADSDLGIRLAGHGYCWGDKCHVEHDALGFHIEETIYLDRRKGTIQHTGSEADADGKLLAIWQDKLHPLL